MNAKAKIHQANLANWTIRFKDQANSGLTATAWCTENGFTIHSYNYWKHLLKEDYVDSALPDIVPITNPSAPHTQLIHATPSCNSLDSLDKTSLRISLGDTLIEIGSSASDEMILRIIQAVRYA